MERTEERYVWHEYYHHFSYFDSKGVRPGCEPKKMVHPEGSDKAVILIHGLTDSPYAMQAIAGYFHLQLGYNVYLPLLQCHGLLEPDGMKNVSLREWKNNVRFAIDFAAADAEQISIGGLSTGGALGFHFATRDSRINSALYLFSAAFGLYGGPGNLIGKLSEYLLTSPLLHLFKSPSALVGVNPYRYDRVPFNSARELVFLMWDNKQMVAKLAKKKAFDKPIFSAWSQADKVVSIDALQTVHEITDSSRVALFEIRREYNLHHACVVLEDPIYAIGSTADAEPLELANPCFEDMMNAVAGFEKTI